MSRHQAANRATLDRYFAAINAENWAVFAGLWCEDAALTAVGARPRRGRDEILAFYERLFEPWAEHEDRPTRVIESGDTATVEVTFTGVTPDGRRLSFDAVDVVDFDAGRIARLTNWYDIAWVRKALAASATA